jgi:ribose 5-phosphate isomerase B
MKILIGSDHAGFELKEIVAQLLRQELGCEVIDAGPHSLDRCDFPVYAEKVARGVVAQEADFGILICGTGIGMSIAANKVPGAYAAHCCDSYSARMARLHNAANILCLGARVLGVEIARDIVRAFLSTPVDEGTAYAARRRQIAKLESGGTVAEP